RDAAGEGLGIGGEFLQAGGDLHAQVLEVLGTGVMGGVEADLGQVGDVHVGDHHGGGTLDLRGCFDRLGDRVLEVGDVLCALLGQPTPLLLYSIISRQGVAHAASG